jgi:hypothetical protein
LVADVADLAEVEADLAVGEVDSQEGQVEADLAEVVVVVFQGEVQGQDFQDRMITAEVAVPISRPQD